jgi:hypothetical protein
LSLTENKFQNPLPLQGRMVPFHFENGIHPMRIVMAAAILIGLAAPAFAQQKPMQTCSEWTRKCRGYATGAGNANTQLALCENYHRQCMQTGVYSSRTFREPAIKK